MLVPLFFSWLSETTGSILPGLAYGDETVQGRGEIVWLLIQLQRRHFGCLTLLSSSPELHWDIRGCPAPKSEAPRIKAYSRHKARAVAALYH